MSCVAEGVQPKSFHGQIREMRLVTPVPKRTKLYFSRGDGQNNKKASLGKLFLCRIDSWGTAPHENVYHTAVGQRYSGADHR